MPMIISDYTTYQHITGIGPGDQGLMGVYNRSGAGAARTISRIFPVPTGLHYDRSKDKAANL